MKQTPFLPLFASTAQLLFDATNCPMALFIFQTLSHMLLVFPVHRPSVCAIALSAQTAQSILSGTFFAKLALAFPFNALGTEFMLHALDCAMRFFITVAFLCHCLLALRRQPPFLNPLVTLAGIFGLAFLAPPL